MKKSLTSFVSYCALAVAFNGGEVCAQIIDYGSLEEMMGQPVTMSATGSPLSASDAPANMTIISADEIRQSGSRSIPAILSRIPGLNILRTGNNAYDVGIRGYQQPMQPRLLVLIDGRQVFLDDYSRTDWANLPVNVDDIRQIEVVLGASSALFGSNAASGVINIVTYSPLFDNSNVASVALGTQKSVIADGTFTVKGKGWGTKTSIGGLNQEEFDTVRPDGDGDQKVGGLGVSKPPEHQYVFNSAVVQLTPKFLINTEATYSNSVNNFGDPTDAYVMGIQYDTSYSVRAGFSWDTPYGLLSSNTYYNDTFVNFYEFADSGAPYTTKLKLIVSQMQDLFKVGTKNTFRVGLEYRHREYRQDDVQIVYQDPLLVQNIYAVSGMWQRQLTDNLTWTNALRLDHEDMAQEGTLAPEVIITKSDYSHAINELSANSELVYKPTPKDTLRAGYGRGVMLPSMIQNGYSQIFSFGPGIFNLDDEGNPRLKPTIVQDYKVDYTRKLDDLHSTAKIALFYEFSKAISAPFQLGETVTIEGDNYIRAQAQNIGGSQGLGGELQIKGSHPDGYRWDASYSLACVRDDGAVRQFVNYEESAPVHQFRLLLGYTKGNWEIDENTQYMTRTNMNRSLDGGATFPAVPTDGYLAVSGRIGYKLTPDLTVSVSGTNLTKRFTRENPYPEIERQLFLALKGTF